MTLTEERRKKLLNFSNGEREIIAFCESNSPQEILHVLKQNKGKNVTEEEVSVIDLLINIFPLSEPVIGMLIYYILLITGNDTIRPNYAFKIAKNWVTSQVKLPEDVIQMTKNRK